MDIGIIDLCDWSDDGGLLGGLCVRNHTFMTATLLEYTAVKDLYHIVA